MRFSSKLFALMGALLVAQSQAPAGAATAAPPRPAKAVTLAAVKPINPALFKIASGKNTMYILGSIHLLPVGFSWHTPVLDQAIDAADVFVFEANLDNSTAEFHYYMDQEGYLPRGQTLHKMLSPQALTKYASLIANNRIDPAMVDYVRPGVAVTMLQLAFMRTQSAVPLAPGVDASLLEYGKSHSKMFAYLESLQTQFELLTALGGGSDVAVLEKMLVSAGKGGTTYSDMLNAWMAGDLKKLASLEATDTDPARQAMMLDNRNKAWLPRIELMLRDSRNYLITVGALHLAGPNGVIQMLCARHWNVQRVQTGPEAPPAACPA